MDKTSKSISKQTLKWIILVLILIGIFLIPVNEEFTMPIKLFFMITLLGILLLAFELTDNIVPALIIPVGYLVFQLAPTTVIFNAWTTQTPWLLVGSMIVAEIMNETGLSKRIAYWCLLKMGGKLRSLMFALLVAGIILAACVPAAIARVALFCGLMVGLCTAMEFKAYSREATVCMIGAYLVASEVSGIFMTGSNNFILTLGFLNSSGYDVDWGAYFFQNGAIRIIWMILTMILLFWVFKPKNEVQSKEYIKQKYDELGKYGVKEKKTLILIIGTILMLLTSKYHGIQPGWIFVIAACLAFLPGINLANRNTVKKVNFTMVFLLAGTVCIGDVSAEVGAGQLIVNALMPFIPTSLIGASVMVYVIAFIGNIILTPLAMIAALMTPIIDISVHMGIDPIMMSYVFNMGVGQLLFPHEILTAILMFSFGMVSMKDFIKYFGLKAILNVVFLIVIAIPWWELIGLV